MTRDEFDDYVRCLKAHDYDGFRKYYARDFRAYFAGRVHDADGAVAFERQLAEISDWTMDVREVVFGETAIAMEFVMQITFTKDTELPGLGPVKAGDKARPHMCALYKLKDAKISELRIFDAPPQ